jgi:hypothetical protein
MEDGIDWFWLAPVDLGIILIGRADARHDKDNNND